MKKLLTFEILACFSFIASAQAFIGKVLDAETNEPIPFATILITETENGFISDANGDFYIDNFPRTRLKLQISNVGYETYVEIIDMSITGNKQFKLKPSHFKLKEVIVSFPVSKLNDENIVEVETKRFESSKGKENISLIQSLSTIAGVDQVSTGVGIGKPVIRGLAGSRIVVYTQSVRLENQQFGDEHGLGENAVGIERVEVVKGPSSLLYGADALGGVLYLVPEGYATQDDTEAFLSSQYLSNAKTINTNGGLKVNKNGIKVNVFGAYNTNVDYVIPDGKRVFNTRFNEMSLKGSMGYNKKNWVGNVRYGYLRNHFGIHEDEIQASTTSRSKVLPFQDVRQQNVSVENVFFVGINEFSAILGYGINEREEFEESLDESTLDMTLKTWTINLKSITSLSDKIQLISGFQGMNRKNVNMGKEILIPDATTKDAGIYGVLNTDFRNFHLQAGARVDFRTISTLAYSNSSKTISALDRDFSSVNFSVGSMYKKGKFTYRFNLATGFRPPNTAELLSDGKHEGTLRYETGNPTLNNERAVQTDFNIKFENQHLTIGVNSFYNKINDYIFLIPTGDSIEDADVYEYRQKDATLYGGELGVHFHPHRIHWLHVESNFSSVFAEDYQGNALPLIPANNVRSKLNIEFSLIKKAIGNIYMEHLYKRAQNRVATMELSSPRYHLFHVGSSLEFDNLKLDIGINNIFDTRFVDHLSRLKNNGVPNAGRNIFVKIKYNI